jgi:hypothetical protein
MPFLFLCLLVVFACTKKTESSGPLTAEQGWERGKSVYISNCASCHNVNPKIDGAVGPAVFSSSRELLEARIMRAEYPAGYTAKRSTKTMVALPHLEKEVPHLVEFLSRDKATP